MGRAVWLSIFVVALAACGDEPTRWELSVDLRTDYLPGLEFTGVRVFLEGEGRRAESLAVAESYVGGRRVAEVDDLPSADRRQVVVELIGAAGDSLARRAVVVGQDSDLAITVVISRDCANVSCDTVGGVADRCLGGRCVDPECVEGDEEACLEPDCATASDCVPMASCAQATCEAGVCLFDVADPSYARGRFLRL